MSIALRVVLVAIALAITGAVVPVATARPAHAAQCYLTLYKDGYFQGQSLTYGITKPYWYNTSRMNFDNVASSWKLNDWCHAILATGQYGQGSWLDVWRATKIAVTPPGWNDVVSSVYVYSVA